MATITVREATSRDDAAAGELARERYDTLGVSHDRDQRDSLGTIRWKPQDRRLVAVADGEVIGYAWLRDWVELAYLEAWVAEGRRGGGAGTLLFGRILEEAARLGRGVVRLVTTEGDERVATFLRRFGFEPAGGGIRMDLRSERPVDPDWPEGFVVRQEAEKSDAFLDLVWRTDQAGFADNPTFVPASRESFAPVVGRDDFELDLAWFAYTADGEDAGFCIASDVRAQSIGVIEDIAVLPAHRRRGLARALLRQAVLALRERGVADIVLETNDHNERAQNLYRSEGFETTYCYRSWKRALP